MAQSTRFTYGTAFSQFYAFVKNRAQNTVGKGLLLDLKWSSVGAVVASLVMFLVQIISGRSLGPGQYGIASFLILAASNLRTLCTLGADMSLIKELSRSDEDSRKTYISSTLFVVISSLVFFGVVWMCIVLSQGIFHHSYNVPWILAYLLVITIGLKLIFEGIARGLFFFKKQAIYKVLEAIVSLVFAVTFFWMYTKTTYVYFVLLTVISGVFIIVLYLRAFIKHISWRYVDLSVAEKIIKTGVLFVINSLIFSSAILIDRYIISRYLGQEMLGVYSAYAIVSVTTASLTSTVIGNVFFVHVARHRNKSSLVKKIDNAVLRTFMPSILFLCGISSLAIMLFGKEYDYKMSYIILFSLYASLSMYSSLYGPLITTHSNRIFGRTLVYFFVEKLVLLSYFVSLVFFHHISIDFILCGQVIDCLAVLVIVRSVVSKHYK